MGQTSHSNHRGILADPIALGGEGAFCRRRTLPFPSFDPTFRLTVISVPLSVLEHVQMTAARAAVRGPMASRYFLPKSGINFSAKLWNRPKKFKKMYVSPAFAKGTLGSTPAPLNVSARAPTRRQSRSPSSALGRGESCRYLCRNPPIPAHISLYQHVSLGHTCDAGDARRTRMNITSRYHSGFFGVALFRTGMRFDTVEVWGSSPH